MREGRDIVDAHPCVHLAAKGRRLGCVHLYSNLKGGGSRRARGPGREGEWAREVPGVGVHTVHTYGGEEVAGGGDGDGKGGG